MTVVVVVGVWEDASLDSENGRTEKKGVVCEILRSEVDRTRWPHPGMEDDRLSVWTLIGNRRQE